MKRCLHLLICVCAWMSAGAWPQTNGSVPAATPGEARFDVEVNDAPARAFFEGLVDGTPYNMLVHPEVTGRVSLRLKQVTVAEALEAVRDLYGYDFHRVATGYMVLPATVQTRIFHLNYLDVQRAGISKTRVSSGQVSQSAGSDGNTTQPGSNTGGESGSSDTKQELSGTAVMTQSTSDFWASIEANLKLMIGSDADHNVVINRQSGVIVVRAPPTQLRDVAEYLQRTQATVTRQVVLEAKIIEVELNDAYQAGVNWAAVLTHGNDTYFLGQRSPQGGFEQNPLLPDGPRIPVAPGNPVGGFLSDTLGGAFTLAADFTDFNAYIDLLGVQGKTRVLSSPRVSTLHNQKAVIKAGSDEFFVTDVSSDTTTGTASTTTVDFTLTPFFSGVALDVTPQISEEGEVLLHIHPTVSEVVDQRKTLTVRGETDILPLAFSQIRESDSIVRARSGQVIVIGGLMREIRDRQKQKTPLLGDVPGLGRLFRSERDQATTVELVILLRPIVVGDGDWADMVKAREASVSALEERKSAK
ncbi:MAG TPA: pilus (MSHA type) biogenesis protein MshL [Steroidobacteraceae bacterium]|nr:pilus (MSHA type) biogenesis protein MshL [Steroidobacteraceae bacterium]